MKKYDFGMPFTSPTYSINVVKYCFNSVMQLCMSKHKVVYIFSCAKQLSLLCPQLVGDLNTKILKLTATYFAWSICG